MKPRPDRLDVRDSSLPPLPEELSLVGAFPSLSIPDRTPFWDRGISRVPELTGVLTVMDCSDLADACQRLQVDLPLRGRVLDVGCGTGRWQRFCSAYIGLDINPSAVAYTRKHGIAAHLLKGYGPAALEGWLGGAEWVCCFSVFTHISARERRDYLQAFTHLAPQVLVDVIPGDESGDVIKWTTDVEAFEKDLSDIGWMVKAIGERTSPDNVTHRYYHLERRSGGG